MATAKKTSLARRTRRRPVRQSRKMALILGGLAVCSALVFAYRAPISGYSAIGAAYAARVSCTCQYIGGRQLSDCRDELEDMPPFLMLSGNDDGKSVTARVPFLASATAYYREGWGCVLERWDD